MGKYFYLKAWKLWLPCDLLAVTLIIGELWWHYVNKSCPDHKYPNGATADISSYLWFSFNGINRIMWALLAVWFCLFPDKDHRGTALVALAYFIIDYIVFFYSGSQSFQIMICEYICVGILFIINGRRISKILSDRAKTTA